MVIALEAYIATTAPSAPRFDSAAATTDRRRHHGRRRHQLGGGRIGQRRGSGRRRTGQRPGRLSVSAADRNGNRTAGPGRPARHRHRHLGEDVMSAQSGRLQHALKNLREQWDIATETWDDPVSRDFEKNHIIPLEQTTKHAIIGMEKVSEILGKLRAQCKED